MSDSSRRSSNAAMDQIIAGMKSHSAADSQYVQLGFTPPPSPSDLNSWTAPTAPIPKSPYLPQYGIGADPNTLYSINQQLPPYVPQQQQPMPYNFVQFRPDLYETHADTRTDLPGNHFVMHPQSKG